jgi:hypothetical protein
MEKEKKKEKWKKEDPTMLLEATHAPLDHRFILKIFLKSFKYIFRKKHLKYLKFF